MISFCTAHGLPQTHMMPEFLTQLAPATKQPSSGPREVANIPAPHGQCMSLRTTGFPQQSSARFWYEILSTFSKFVQAITACSSPGYEIFGHGGIGQVFGFPGPSTQE